jgi:ADP-L-glycero-D-manno-heptose 6-epimerase
MSKIVVTGGAGFIGSNLVRGLNKLGYKNIIIADSFSVIEKYQYVKDLEFDELIHKDELIDDLHKRSDIEVIFHQGACSSTTETDGAYLIKNNYSYSVTLLDYAIKYSIPFLYASSASVYGNGENGFYEKRECENPLNLYAYSKWLFDEHVRKLLKWYTASPVIGTRYFNVYGYNENHKGRMASVIHKFYDEIIATRKISLFEGSEKILRDFVFSEDIVKMNLFLLNKGVSGIYNCGTGKARSFMDIALCYQTHFTNSQIEITPFPKDLAGKYQYFTEASLSNLLDIGYSNEYTDLYAGIKLFIDYRKLNMTS